ncbi:MAG TPA: hypothetical protein VFV70_15995 [Hyphomonadaceae bacterium]|nr:hypothetical protein [Hyphomonadaceae bacterium]
MRKSLEPTNLASRFPHRFNEMSFKDRKVIRHPLIWVIMAAMTQDLDTARMAGSDTDFEFFESVEFSF